MRGRRKGPKQLIWFLRRNCVEVKLLNTSLKVIRLLGKKRPRRWWSRCAVKGLIASHWVLEVFFNCLGWILFHLITQHTLMTRATYDNCKRCRRILRLGGNLCNDCRDREWRATDLVPSFIPGFLTRALGSLFVKSPLIIRPLAP